jgi:hypothetical protein
MLTADALSAIAAFIPSEDWLPAALACKALKVAITTMTEDGSDKPRWVTMGTSSTSRLKWAIHVMGATPTVRWCEAAAERGDETTLIYLHSYDAPWNENVVFAAARGGHVELIKYLHYSRGVPWALYHWLDTERSACRYAAMNGHFTTVQWLREQNPPCPWDPYLWESCAMTGQLAVLQWALAQNPPCPCADYSDWDADDWAENYGSCAAAVEFGHLDILQLFRAQDPPCPWDARCCVNAARNGDLPILQWMRDSTIHADPCAWDKWACLLAARNGHVEVLKWMRAQNPPCPWNKRKCLTGAMSKGHTAVVEWIESL